ncbi:polysaccharide deacetylase [Neobacillus bataviensis LMG 21833]|uniref:Polysaccharide deacetylase n=1 Tax=Neobacillus bataviensis LMG 21833 TaxID=1117379 RepID=K6DM53_9BACI|nr:leucine-rich repeat domain-containing protein [Neobacillus bataviensis]EKN69389.1 polysaccharide deacetylase [Neobacillus bataviensis LMG 21833]
MKSALTRSLGQVKDRFNRYRYWEWYYGNLIRGMEKAIDKRGFGHMSPYINKPGIAFSFDDSYRVGQWVEYGKEMFGYYDVKVTFNVNAFHHFEGEREHTQKEIDMLLELQSCGHELAHHGFKHQSAVSYANENGSSAWIKDEIISLFDWMENQAHSKTKEKFKKPVTFAFPFAEYNEENISELVPDYFKIVRGQLVGNNLTPFSHTGLAPSLCIDSKFVPNVKYIKRIMKAAKQTGCNLIFMCHSILPKEAEWDDFGWGEDPIGSGEWRITPDTIQTIINEAKRMDMEFYTTAELANVATFIDRNLGSCVRNHIANPYGSWISISELSAIKELDLSGKDISNLDGIQYFTKLEMLNLNNNNISDFRLIERLPNLKKIDIGNNPISSKIAPPLAGLKVLF